MSIDRSSKEQLTDERIGVFLSELDGYSDRVAVVRKWFGSEPASLLERLLAAVRTHGDSMREALNSDRYLLSQSREMIKLLCTLENALPEWSAPFDETPSRPDSLIGLLWTHGEAIEHWTCRCHKVEGLCMRCELLEAIRSLRPAAETDERHCLECGMLFSHAPECQARAELLPRYGIEWQGPDKPISKLMHDGYWTPWHLAVLAVANAKRAAEKTSPATAPDPERSPPPGKPAQVTQTSQEAGQVPVSASDARVSHGNPSRRQGPPDDVSGVCPAVNAPHKFIPVDSSGQRVCCWCDCREPSPRTAVMVSGTRCEGTVDGLHTYIPGQRTCSVCGEGLEPL